MADETSTLIIPVESQVRELEAKLLLACAAAERGFPVVIGSRAYVHHRMARFPRGVYLAKSMRTMSDRMFDIIRKLGHHIVAWDEEGLVRFPDEFYYQRRLSARAVPKINHLIAWGEDDARALRGFPAYHGCPIHVTGNPRIDLMRPEIRGIFDRERDEIAREHGDFILVNTNFSGLNHFHAGLSELTKNLPPADGGPIRDPFMAGRAAFRKRILEHFEQLIPALREALPDLRIVVRPHPSENHALWRQIAAGLDDVVVVNRGNVYPWLMASRALVHNGCTTAVEAAVLGTPAVAFQPVTDPVFDMTLPNSVSHQALDLKDVQKTVQSIVAGEIGVRDDPEVRAVLARHLAALDGPLASDRLVGVLVDAGYLDGRPPSPPIHQRLEATVHLTGRTAVKWVNRYRPGHRNNLDFHRHRFPGTSVSGLDEGIALFGRQLGRFGGIRARELSEHVYEIRRS